MSIDKISFENIYEGEYMISELVKSSSKCSVHFEYATWLPNHQWAKLNLITYNLVHKAYFLLHNISSDSEESLEKNKIACLEKMYDHIYGIKELLSKNVNNTLDNEKCYTIKWSDTEKQGLQTSFFYGKTIDDVIKKFYYGKSTTRYTIFFMSLNSDC
jgi:hypothetical protein